MAGWQLPAHVHASLLWQARAAAPRECCGLLLADAQHGVLPLALVNQALSDDAFAVGDHDLLALARLLRSSGRTVLAQYHSHPQAPAQPSAADLALADPGLAQIIISLLPDSAPALRGWQIRDGQVAELTLEFCATP